MNAYEELQDQACADGIDVIDYVFNSQNIKGLYCNETVAISKTISTQTEKACVLAEELGHHYTTTGNILNQSLVENRKQELQARVWAYNHQIGLIGIVNAWKRGCRNQYEIAEYLEVTEDFLMDAMAAYRNKYGCCKAIDNYVIYFQPYLAVMEFV